MKTTVTVSRGLWMVPVDRTWDISGHRCRSDRSAVLFTVMRAATWNGHPMPVHTPLSAKQFLEIAAKVYPETKRDGNVVFGIAIEAQWKVKIYSVEKF